MEENITKNKTLLLIFIIFLFGVGALLLNYSKKQNNQDTDTSLTWPNTKPISPSKSNLPGKIILKYDKDLSDKSNMVFIAIADSKNQPITSFDIDIRYNHNKLKKVLVENLIPDYDIVPTDIQIETNFSELIITGIQSQYNNEKIGFNNTQLAKITFMPLVPISQDDIKLFFVIDSTSDSNLVNENNQDILGHVSNPSINL